MIRKEAGSATCLHRRCGLAFISWRFEPSTGRPANGIRTRSYSPSGLRSHPPPPRRTERSNLRILLLNPPFSGLYHRLGFILPPLGLAYLASSLRERGHVVSITDLNVEGPPSDLAAYDLIGVTADTPAIQKP